MNNEFPFHGQKELPLITKADIDAFNMERFQFTEDARSFRKSKPVHDLPGKAVGVSPMEALRNASLRLIESAFGVSKAELPAITDTVLQRYTGTEDDSVW